MLDSAFRIYRASLVPCLPHGLAVTLAGQLANIYAIARRRPLHGFGGHEPLWWVLSAVGACMALAAINATVIRQHAISIGSPRAAGNEVKQALLRLPASLAVSCLVCLAVAACFAPLLAVPRAYGPVAVSILTFPATYLAVALSCVWMNVLLGECGPWAAIRQSLRLVRGNWWRTTAVYTVAVATLSVFFVLAGMIVGFLSLLLGIADFAVMTAATQVTAVALVAAAIPFYSAIALAVYGDLQGRRSGTDLEQRIADIPASG